MGKALGNIDFARFFNKKNNYFLTMIDIELIFLYKLRMIKGHIQKINNRDSEWEKPSEISIFRQ